jgi:hypothetical protein
LDTIRPDTVRADLFGRLFEDAQFPPPKREMAKIFPVMLDVPGFDAWRICFAIWIAVW